MRERIRVIIGGHDLPEEDIQERVVAALIIGALIVGVLVALPWIGGW